MLASSLPLAARLAITQTSTCRWSLAEDAAAWQRAGVPAIGLWRRKVLDVGVEQAAALLAQHGVSPVSLSWAGGFTGSDGHAFDESVADAAECLRMAARLRAAVVVVHAGTRNGHTQNHSRRLIVSALKQLVPLAVDLDVQLAIKPMHPNAAANWTFLTTWDETLAVLDAVSSPFVQAVLDWYHFAHVEEMCDVLPRLNGRVALVQLADANGSPSSDTDRRPLGTGTLPLARLICSTEAIGYTGFYEVECHGPTADGVSYEALIQQTAAAFARISTPSV